MHHTHKVPKLVEKEEIPDLSFPKSEILHSHEKIAERRHKLEKAMKLGNNHKHKVRIIFEDNEGLKEVDTTIWSAMEKNVSLKAGTHIPVHRIHDIII